MILTIVIASFLLATVSSVSLNKKSMMAQLFEDPDTFVATFQNADPVQIQTVIDMVDSLIETGNTEKQNAIDEYNKALANSILADQAYDEADRAEKLALGEVHLANAHLEQSRTNVQLAEEAEASALIEKNTAWEAHGHISIEFEAEIYRIDDEKAILENIQAILLGLLPSERRLLAMIKVDPESVSAVNEIVLEMLATGEREREAITKLESEAKALFDEKSNFYNSKVADHVTKNDVLSKAETDLDEKVDIADDKSAITQTKLLEKNAAQAVLTEKVDVKDSEIDRVNDENEILYSVRDKLVALFPR